MRPEDSQELPTLDPSLPPPLPITISADYTCMDDDTTNDEEMPFVIDDPDSDLEDEDADFYYGSNTDAFLPSASDLPRMGDGPRRSAPSQDQRTTAAARGNDRMIVVVDIDRVHELPFTFCQCPNAVRDDLQLLDLGYYPASIQQPKTVFTTRLLDDFLLSNKECKTSARNYYNKLRRTTNAAFPHMVPVSPKCLLSLHPVMF